MKKIILSVSIIAVVAAIAFGVTTAFFSDTETSTGNTFTAGKLDLKVGSECHYYQNGVDIVAYGHGCPGSSATVPHSDYGTFGPTDLENVGSHMFFYLNDVKPGDQGENTITLRVEDNPAWVCASVLNLRNLENDCNDPETKAGDTTCGTDIDQGELMQNLFFTIWRDTDCDNELDNGETVLADNQNPTLGTWAIADSTTGTGPVPGETDYCLGMSWIIPPETGNIIQTDGVHADIKFDAIQSRNNTDFRCVDLVPPVCVPTNGGVETCDGVDNDCDGQIDEDLRNCACTGASSEDVIEIKERTDICNGVDDNCNSDRDEGCTCIVNSVVPCHTGLPGVCDNGLKACITNGGDSFWEKCWVNTDFITTEICNGLDDDCDGAVDEGCPL